MIWVFKSETVKAKFNHRVAETHFSYGSPVYHLWAWLVSILIGSPTNERISSACSKENDCSHVWVTDSKLHFVLSVMETAAEGYYFGVLMWGSLCHFLLFLTWPISQNLPPTFSVSLCLLSSPDACADEGSHHQTLSSFFCW